MRDFKGATKSEEKMFKAIQRSIGGVTMDDSANTLTGMDGTMEFSTDEGDTWTIYNEDSPNLPDLSGTLDILVRYAETDTHYAGPSTEFNFTA